MIGYFPTRRIKQKNKQHIFLSYFQLTMRMKQNLLEGDEPGGVGGTNTWATVLHGFVGDGELTKVVSDHLGLKGRGKKRQ